MNTVSPIATFWLQAATGWHFDLLSAFVGAMVTAFLAVVLYLYREAVGRAAQALQHNFRQMLDKLTAGVEMRYYDGLLAYLPRYEVLPYNLSLEALYVAPRFIAPQPRPSLAEEELIISQIVLRTAWRGTRRLLVTGRAGSGRTALLLHLARTFAEQNRQSTHDPQEKSLPIYAHLAELNESMAAGPTSTEVANSPDAPAGAQSGDPANPLIANVLANTAGLIAGNLGSVLRQALNSGQALVLLDGLDDLSRPDQKRAMVWISKLCEQYPQPRYIIASPVRGYDLLIDSGFTALRLAEWDAEQAAELAKRWAKVNPSSDEEAQRLSAALTPPSGGARLPFDVCIAAMVWQNNAATPAIPSSLYGYVVDSLLQATEGHSPLSPMLSRAALGRLATLLLKEDRLMAKRDEFEAIVAELLPFDIKSIEEQAEAQGSDSSTPVAPTPGKSPKSVSEAIKALVGTTLLKTRGQNDYGFPHHRLMSYLAAWNLAQFNDIPALLEHLNDPAWADVLEFCAGMINMTPLVEAHTAQEDDLFHTNLWARLRWVAAAPAGTKWGGPVMGEAVRIWMQPNQPPQVGEQVMHSLLATQDKGLRYVFKKIMSNPKPTLRAQAVRAMGLIAKEADLPDITQALKDPELEVQEAAIQALGSMACEAATEPLVEILLEADEFHRQVAAQALAGCGEKGQHILKDAAADEDLLVRRSAVYGLCLIRQPWVVETLTDLERNDSQWAVRSSATDALRIARRPELELELDLTPLKLDEQGWLIEWAATRGISVGLGRAAQPVLMQALGDNSARVKLAAIRTLARMGDNEVIGPLRQALQDADPAVCNAAWRTLDEISARTGKKIPAK